jgi:hypothetical protein
VAQGLAITTLELTTLAFIFVLLPSWFLWWYKPMDVTTRRILYCATPLAEILHKVCVSLCQSYARRLTITQAGVDTAAEWFKTPLDFISREEWVASIMWSHYVRILRMMHLLPPWDTSRPIARIPTINFLRLSAAPGLCTVALIFLYSSIFFAAWNSDFPSHTEQMLWRITSVMTLVYGLSSCLITMFCERIWMAGRLTSWKSICQLPEYCRLEELQRRDFPAHAQWFGTRQSAMYAGLRNLSKEDPLLYIPLRIWVPITVTCALYSFARAYVLIEDIIGLRDLPKSAFETVSWMHWFPHF